MDRGREDVIGTLPHVHVIVRMYRLPADVGGHVRQHLVDVHVGTGAGAGLEDIDRELAGQLTAAQAIRRLTDRRRDIRIEQTGFAVDLCADAFDQADGANGRERHRDAADREIVHRALGLRAVKGIGGDLEFPHAVAFGTESAGAHRGRFSLLGIGRDMMTRPPSRYNRGHRRVYNPPLFEYGETAWNRAP